MRSIESPPVRAIYRLLNAAIRLGLCILVLLPVPNLAADEIAQNSKSRAVVSRVSAKLAGELERQNFVPGAPLFVRIFKAERVLEVWLRAKQGFRHFKSYPICAYSGAVGPKLAQGDRQSPEGFYFVTPRRLNPWSRYHLSFDLGYPNAYDRAHRRTGDFLMVHGDCVSIGCYAMTNPGIEEIYTLASMALSNGQGFFRVHVFPFRLSDENLARHSNSPWQSFWQNLRIGYDWFEQHRLPPNVEVNHRKYVFSAQ
jgi:murein L,D-transpeptidase YafK